MVGGQGDRWTGMTGKQRNRIAVWQTIEEMSAGCVDVHSGWEGAEMHRRPGPEAWVLQRALNGAGHGQVLLAAQIWSDLLPHQFGSYSHCSFACCLHPGGRYQRFTLLGFSGTGRPQNKVRFMDLERTGPKNVPSYPVTRKSYLPCHRPLIQVLRATGTGPVRAILASLPLPPL